MVVAAGASAKPYALSGWNTEAFGERNYIGTKQRGSVDMSSKSNGSSIKRKRPKGPKSRPRKVVLCLRNDGYHVALEPRKVYEVIADRKAAKDNYVRVIDESGEDYLYPASYFAELSLPNAVRRALLAGQD
jgi:hypothetical protein